MSKSKTPAFPVGHWTRNALVISAGVHLAFLLFAVVFVAIRIIHKPQSVLIAERPPRPALELRELEMRVRVADLQQNSARPRLQPRLVALSPAEISLPKIKTTPQEVQQRLKRDVAAVGISGLGSGIGGGLGTGAGGGSGEMNFFGLKGTGEKVCLIVDMSLSMCEDERGGLRGFQTLKREVSEVIDGVGDGALFNVMVFEDQVSRCWDRMRPAGRTTRREAGDWVDSFNRMQGPYGVARSNYSPGTYGMETAGGTSRLDLALTAAFEQGADTIFVITDGVPRIRKPVAGDVQHREVYDPGHTVTDDERRAWEDAMEAWRKDQAKRERKGVGTRLSERGSGPPREPRDRPAGTLRIPLDGGEWSTEDILEHIRTLQAELYTTRGRREAQVSAVGYEVSSETRRFLRKLARDNNGKYRSISGR